MFKVQEVLGLEPSPENVFPSFECERDVNRCNIDARVWMFTVGITRSERTEQNLRAKLGKVIC